MSSPRESPIDPKGSPTQEIPTESGEDSQQQRRRQLPFKTINIRHVPFGVWKHARQNAMASDMAFGDYVIRLLSNGGSYPAESK